MNAISRSLLASHAVHGGASSNREPLTEHDKLVRNTQKWVAQTFYGAMLKEMRKSPFHNEEFEGGREGQAYQEMFDQRLADHMSQSSGSPLVNSIVNHIEKRQTPHSPRQVLDATTAYARIMRHDKPVQPKLPDPTPKPHALLPAPPRGHRRQEKILPELLHVAPTN